MPGGILAFRSGPCLTKAGVGAALGGGEVAQDLMPAPYAVQQQLADLHQVFSPPVPAVCGCVHSQKRQSAVNRQISAACLVEMSVFTWLADPSPT